MRQVASPLDDVDRRILAELSRDGRMSIRTLAETLHISRANAYARVQRLRDTKVIRGFRADVDHVAAGMGTSAYVTVNLHQAEWRTVSE
jgi:DNA-binding Lrp family transcriptional regulator